MAAFLTGILNLVASPFARQIRDLIPRTSLIAAISGLTLTAIVMAFATDVYQQPTFAILPFFVVVRSWSLPPVCMRYLGSCFDLGSWSRTGQDNDCRLDYLAVWWRYCWARLVLGL
jgi:hypothetical protein